MNALYYHLRKAPFHRQTIELKGSSNGESWLEEPFEQHLGQIADNLG